MHNLWDASTRRMDKASHLTVFLAWDSSPHFLIQLWGLVLAKMYPAHFAHLGLPLLGQMWFIDCSCISTCDLWLQVYVGPSALYEKTKGVSKAGGVVSERTSEWMEVEPGEEKPFDFSSKGKMRHRVRKLSVTLLDLSSRPAVTHCTIGNSWPLISLPDLFI